MVKRIGNNKQTVTENGYKEKIEFILVSYLFLFFWENKMLESKHSSRDGVHWREPP